MPPSCALLGGFAIGARDALLWQHYGNAWQSPAVIRQAQRTPHACRTHTHYACRRRLPSPAIKSTCPLRAPFHFVHTAGVVMRTRNVSEYMLVLALCLVNLLLAWFFCYVIRWIGCLIASLLSCLTY